MFYVYVISINIAVYLKKKKKNNICLDLIFIIFARLILKSVGIPTFRNFQDLIERTWLDFI